MTLLMWRHPRPQTAAGRCIGRTDVPVDRRRAKRLAHRVRQAVRDEMLPRRVFTSPLQRCAAVGRALRRMGFVYVVDSDLLELDFGAWDGRLWRHIEHAEVAAWEADFMRHRPGGGESLDALLTRVRRFCARSPQGVVIGHAGWINAWCWLMRGSDKVLTAAAWPPAPAYGQRITAPLSSA